MRKRIGLALIFSAFCLVVSAASQPTKSSTTLAAASSNAPAANTVEISNFQFTPKLLSVRVGTTVTWTSKEGTHTVTADNGVFASDNLTAGQSFSYTFTKPGTYRYHCSFHGSKGGGGMSGVIKVRK
ncbi:MAG TPA: plastocyanin/azurin family copper-binding protein [Pyrinomonadaceae bacterium]